MRSVANQNAVPSIAIAVATSTIRQFLDEVSQWLAPLARETHAVNHAMDVTKAPTENVTLAEAGIAAPTDPRMTRVSSHKADCQETSPRGGVPNRYRRLWSQMQE